MKQERHTAQGVPIQETPFCLAEQEERKAVRRIIQNMTVYSSDAGEYELFHDRQTDSISVKRVGQRTDGGCYFMTRDDAYACLLLVGENRMKKYLRTTGGSTC